MNASAPCTRSNDQRERYPQDQNQSCPAALPEQQPPRRDVPTRSCPDRSGATPSQQNQSGSRNNDDSIPNVAVWNPDIRSYSEFTDRRFTTDNGPWFMTSERIADDRCSVNEICPAEVGSPANDNRADDDYDDDYDDDDNGVDFSGGSNDWSDETGPDRPQTGRYRDDDCSSGSLSTLTSDTSSIEQRASERRDRNNDDDGRADCTRNSDRFPYEGDRDFGRTLNDITEARVQHIENVSIPDIGNNYWEYEDAVSYVSQTPVDIIIQGARMSDPTLSRSGRGGLEACLEGNNSRSARHTDRRPNTSMSSRSTNSHRRNDDQAGMPPYSC